MQSLPMLRNQQELNCSREAQGPLVCLHGQSHMILDNEVFLSQAQLLHL